MIYDFVGVFVPSLISQILYTKGHAQYLVVASLVRGRAIIASSRLLVAVVSAACVRAAITVAVAPTVLVIAATIVACQVNRNYVTTAI